MTEIGLPSQTSHGWQATSPSVEVDGSEWSVVERRRPRRQRTAPAQPALPVDVAHSPEAGDRALSNVPEQLTPAELASAPVPVTDTPESETPAEPAAAILAAVSTSLVSDGQKKKKKKKKRRKEESDPASDDSRSGPAKAWTPTSVEQRPQSTNAQEVDEPMEVADTSTAEAIAAVARIEAAEVGAGDKPSLAEDGGWATVTRRRPRRANAVDERSSGDGADVAE